MRHHLWALLTALTICASVGCPPGDDDDTTAGDDDSTGGDDDDSTSADDDDDSTPGDDDDSAPGDDDDSAGDDDDSVAVDADGDGWASDEDCDDSDPDIHPGADEDPLDGVDSDCDGVEEGPYTEVLLGLADALLRGAPCDQAGIAVAGAGDVNGDGYDDVLVGATQMLHGCAGRGTAYLLYGPVLGLLELTTADADFPGEVYLDSAGEAVASAGDVNGDGYDDLLISAPNHSDAAANAGAVYLIHGPVFGTRTLDTADARLLGENHNDFTGRAVASAGDIDGDGLPDLLVGSAWSSYAGAQTGVVYVVSGTVSGTLDLGAADGLLTGEGPGHFAGYAVAGAGDMNGDGQDDVWVSAVAYDHIGGDGGAVYLVHGPLSGTRDLSTADAVLEGRPGDFAGCSVSSAGDVDGDGNLDVLVGSCGLNESYYDAGAAYLIHGPVSGVLDLSTVDTRFLGENLYADAGFSVAGVRDTDGDGLDDLLVGAPGTEVGGSNVGAAYHFHGPVTGPRYLSSGSVTYVGEGYTSHTGQSVAGAGDLNADGHADIVIGASRAQSLHGAAYLIYGRP